MFSTKKQKIKVELQNKIDNIISEINVHSKIYDYEFCFFLKHAAAISRHFKNEGVILLLPRGNKIQRMSVSKLFIVKNEFIKPNHFNLCKHSGFLSLSEKDIKSVSFVDNPAIRYIFKNLTQEEILMAAKNIS